MRGYGVLRAFGADDTRFAASPIRRHLFKNEHFVVFTVICCGGCGGRKLAALPPMSVSEPVAADGQWSLPGYFFSSSFM